SRRCETPSRRYGSRRIHSTRHPDRARPTGPPNRDLRSWFGLRSIVRPKRSEFGFEMLDRRFARVDVPIVDGQPSFVPAREAGQLWWLPRGMGRKVAALTDHRALPA